MPRSALVGSRRFRTLPARAFARGRHVFIPGWKNWLLAQLPRLSPRRLVTTIVIWVTGPTE